MRVYITSLLDKDHSDDLEQLLYFHPQQEHFRQNIIACVEKYGSPQIIERDGGLRIQLELLKEVQTLYAIAQNGQARKLAGVVVYTRIQDGDLEIVHIVVKDEYTMKGKKAKDEVAAMLIEEVCRIARRIHGVHSVRLAYNRGRIIVKPRVGSSSGDDGDM